MVPQRPELVADQAVDVEVEDDGALRLAGLGPGRPLGRAAVDDGREAVTAEHLVAVDVSAEHRGDVAG
jgi:hypothetical protein